VKNIKKKFDKIVNKVTQLTFTNHA